MRLLFFVYSLEAGGAERATASLANYWGAKGWEVFVATLTSRESDFYTLHPRVERIALNLAGESGNMAMAAWNNLRRAKAVRAVLRRVRPQVAVSMMSTANILLALAAWGMPNLLCIGSERIHPAARPLREPWQALRRVLYGALGAVVALTPETAAWLKGHTRAKRVLVIPNAVPWPLPVQEPVLSVEGVVSGGRQMLLAVGRMDEHKGFYQKGFDLLLEAFSNLAGKYPNWDLVILGEAPLGGAFESRARGLGLGTRVMLPGRAGNVGDWYRRADLYVLSSRFEGFPNTLVEALACGAAAVSFNCDTGPRDILRHEVDGLLVPPGDVKELAAALDRLMGDPDLRGRYGARGTEARERFSLERIAGLWENLFREAVQ